MFTLIKSMRSFLFTLAISAVAVGVIWMLLKHLSNSKTPVVHPSPTAKYLKGKIQGPLTATSQPVNWLHLKGAEGHGWTLSHTNQPWTGQGLEREHTLLLVDGRGPDLSKALYQTLFDHNKLNSVTILSPADGLLKDIRFRHGEMALSYGQGFLVRLQALLTFGLQELVVFDKDVAWIPKPIPNSSKKKLRAFFSSKNIPVILGPMDQLPPESTGQKDSVIYLLNGD